VSRELAEDKGTSFGLPGGYAINHYGSGQDVMVVEESTLALLSTHQPEALVTSAAEVPSLVLPCRA